LQRERSKTLKTQKAPRILLESGGQPRPSETKTDRHETPKKGGQYKGKRALSVS